MEERDNCVYWSVWIWWPGTSDPQEYKALVEFDLDSDPLEGTSKLFLQQVSSKFSDRD